MDALRVGTTMRVSLTAAEWPWLLKDELLHNALTLLSEAGDYRRTATQRGLGLWNGSLPGVVWI